MSANVTDISNWSASTAYSLHDIVKQNNLIYYVTVPHTSSASFDSTKFGGQVTFQGQSKTKFIWKPSYDSSYDFEPKVKNIKFGDGYSQRVPDGINNSLFKFTLQFNRRSLAEMTAIIHFLRERKGSESFVYNNFAPFNNDKLYICQQFSSPFTFYDNFSLSALFEEVAA